MNGRMNSSNPNKPREGSKVRLIGLKSPDFNGKIGNITSYSRGGERVMVALVDGPQGQGLVKVKPKQIEVLEEPSDGGGGGGGGGGRPDRHRSRNPSRGNMRSASRDNAKVAPHEGRGLRQSTSRKNFNGNNGSQPHMNHRSSVRRSQDNFRDDVSHVSRVSHMSMDQDLMETLRSADAMFDLADTSGDGVVSQEEFEYYMEEHTDHDSDMILECFYMIDADGNGDITREEVRSAFLKKKREMKEGAGRGGDGASVTSRIKNFEEDVLAVSKDADDLFVRADFDGSGIISLREFELYMKRHTSHSHDAIHELFDSMDTDKNGYITREEVRKAYMEKRNGEGGEKRTLMDILGLQDEDMAEIEDDVYSMFFLAPPCSLSYWFAIVVFLMKVGLIIIIAVDLFAEKFPDTKELPALVKTTQFLLLPVNVSVQEELITTFYIYANLKWSEQILEVCPGASKGKYHLANLMRFLDGIAFLFINTVLLLQAEGVLGAFSNFTALQFLSSIDNVVLHLARDGYLTESLELVAKDVLLMTLPKNHNHKLQLLDSVLLMSVFLGQLVAWVLFVW